jgi:hypothetical protein
VSIEYLKTIRHTQTNYSIYKHSSIVYTWGILLYKYEITLKTVTRFYNTYNVLYDNLLIHLKHILISIILAHSFTNEEVFLGWIFFFYVFHCQIYFSKRVTFWSVFNKSAVSSVRRVWRCKRGYQNSYIDEGQTTQWPKEKGQTTIYKTYN